MELVSTVEIKALYGLDRMQVFRLVRSGDFPKPVAELGIGRIWEKGPVVEAVRELKDSGRLRTDGKIIPRYLLASSSS